MYRDPPPPNPLIVARDGRVVARDRHSGETRWTARLGDPTTRAICDGPMRCIVQNERVYVLGRVGAPGWMNPPTQPRSLACLDVKDGRLLWRVDFEESRAPLGVLRETLLLDGELLFMDDGSETVAVQSATGEVRWRVASGSSQTPAALATDGKESPANAS